MLLDNEDKISVSAATDHFRNIVIKLNSTLNVVYFLLTDRQGGRRTCRQTRASACGELTYILTLDIITSGLKIVFKLIQQCF